MGGKMAETANQAYEVAQWIKSENPDAELILKAQVHAGGRGKGSFDSGLKGGVQICDTPEEVRDYTKQMLGYNLVTHQTGPEGQLCQKVLVNEGITIDSEKYLAIIMDRETDGPCIVASPKGGMDIEEVAENDPDSIHTVIIDPRAGIQSEQSEQVARALEFPEHKIAMAQHEIESLYNLFMDTDATQVEINPFAEGGVPGGEQDQIFCVDAKLNFDDNAMFRQKEVFAMRDFSCRFALASFFFNFFFFIFLYFFLPTTFFLAFFTALEAAFNAFLAFLAPAFVLVFNKAFVAAFLTFRALLRAFSADALALSSSLSPSSLSVPPC